MCGIEAGHRGLLGSTGPKACGTTSVERTCSRAVDVTKATRLLIVGNLNGLRVRGVLLAFKTWHMGLDLDDLG